MAKKSLQTKQGKVISKSGDKTIKVSVVTRKRHKRYHKVMNASWSALVHDELNEANIGDTVKFVSCRPLSARKTWRVTDVSKGRPS